MDSGFTDPGMVASDVGRDVEPGVIPKADAIAHMRNERFRDRCCVCGLPERQMRTDGIGRDCDICEALGSETRLCGNDTCVVLHMKSHELVKLHQQKLLAEGRR